MAAALFKSALTCALALTWLIIGQSRLTPLLTPSLYAKRMAHARKISATPTFVAALGYADIAFGLGILYSRWVALASAMFTTIGLELAIEGQDVGMPVWLMVGQVVGGVGLWFL